MTTTIKKFQIISLILNLSIFIMEIIGLSLSISNHGLALFQFYTEDSNIFAMLVSGIYSIFIIINLKNNTNAFPTWVRLIKYMSVCCLTVTFIVVIFVLAPMAGDNGYKFMLFSSSMLYHHFLCPIVAFLSFVGFESTTSLKKIYTLYALIPTCLYAGITIILNIAKVLTGPYPFLRVYEQPIYMSILWCIIILGTAFILALLIRIVSNAIFKKVSANL